MTPYTYLRIGCYAVAGSVFLLLTLFLAYTPLDPVIQGITLLFYMAAIVAMAGTLRYHFWGHAKRVDGASESDSLAPPHSELSSSVEGDSPKPDAAQAKQPKRQQRAPIILLTRHDHTAKVIHEYVSRWDHTLNIVSSCAEASQTMLNRIVEAGTDQEVTLIVDAQDLEMDPIHLPALIRHEATQTTLKLICIASRREASRTQQLLDAGYTATLDTPIDKSQLFSAITTQEDHAANNSNVVSLTHYRQRTERQVRKRILLADLQSADRKRIAARLQAAGHRVTTVENGEQALDALESKRFDVALINLQLPIMSGTQVIKLHRFTTPHSQWVSFIVMTDQTTPATLRLCRDLQVNACLFKPAPTEALLEMVDTAPVVAPALPAALLHVPDITEHTQEIRFLHADLIDTKVLLALDQLDSDSGFLPDLIAIFERDSVVILQGMEDAVECLNATRFTELSSILMDNAGQLGAFALYEKCLTLQQMSNQELNATLAPKLAHLRELVILTTQAFQHYLRERENQSSDLS